MKHALGTKYRKTEIEAELAAKEIALQLRFCFSAIILSPDEYARLTEIEEDYLLLLEANGRLEASGDKPAIPFQTVLENLGISEEEIEKTEDVEIE